MTELLILDSAIDITFTLLNMYNHLLTVGVSITSFSVQIKASIFCTTDEYTISADSFLSLLYVILTKAQC